MRPQQKPVIASVARRSTLAAREHTYVITNADGTVNVITDVISNIVDSGGNNTLVVSGQTVAGASTI